MSSSYTFLFIFICSCSAKSQTDHGLAGVIKQMQAEIAEMKAEIAVLKAHRRQADQFLGFAAYSDVDQYFTDRGQKMVFNKAPTNINSDYNTETGIYTISQKGWYFFGTTVFTDDHHVVLQIMRSGERQPGAFADYSNHDSGSMMWVMQCNPGDQVYLEQYHDGGGAVWRGRAADDLLNAFVGFMISPIFE